MKETIKYVECTIGIKRLSQCNINGVASGVQTIKHLPFLTAKINGFYWNPKIDLKTGYILNWPKNLQADIFFDTTSIKLKYKDENDNLVCIVDSIEVPDFLQLDLINKESCISIHVENSGYINNLIK